MRTVVGHIFQQIRHSAGEERHACAVMEQDSPDKLQNLGHALFNSMVDSESPVMPGMHFMVPVKEGNENRHVEFFIDKNAEERKGGG